MAVNLRPRVSQPRGALHSDPRALQEITDHSVISGETWDYLQVVQTEGAPGSGGSNLCTGGTVWGRGTHGTACHVKSV